MSRRKLAVFSIAIFAGLLAAGCVGLSNATSVPIQRSTNISIAGLPGEIEPFRIALLSDIHVGNLAMRPERLTDIVRQVNEAKPNIVLLAGDFIIGESEAGAAKRARDLAPLSGLNAPDGVFAVLGNHDHWTDPEAIRRNLADAGISVLENEAVGLGRITLVGIGDRFSGHDNISLAAKRAEAIGGVPIAFTHSPDISPDLPEHFRVLLAGHTHCGQMVAPLVGPIVRYSQGRRLYDQKYRCGRTDDANRSTIVTAGVGPGAVPLRFNAMPDWWMVELRLAPETKDKVAS